MLRPEKLVARIGFRSHARILGRLRLHTFISGLMPFLRSLPPSFFSLSFFPYSQHLIIVVYSTTFFLFSYTSDQSHPIYMNFFLNLYSS